MTWLDHWHILGQLTKPNIGVASLSTAETGHFVQTCKDQYKWENECVITELPSVSSDGESWWEYIC